MVRCALFTFILGLSCFGVVPGCAKKPEHPPTYPVTGAVTQGGKPVAKATIVFVPSGTGEAATAVTDAEGKFSMTSFTSGDGVQTGEYRVKISKYDVKAPTADEKQRYMSQAEEQKIYFEDERPTPPSKNLLPKKYENQDTSGITHTVKDGPSTLNIDIK